MSDTPVKVVKTTYDDAYEWALALDGSRHQKVPYESWNWFRWLRRETGADRLMAYRNAESGRIVVGVWVYAPWEAVVPIVEEIAGFHGDPRASWPEGLPPPDAMRLRLRPVEEVLREREAVKKAREYDRRKGLMDAKESKAEAQKALRRRGKTEAAHALNYAPWANPTDEIGSSMKSTAKFVRKKT